MQFVSRHVIIIGAGIAGLTAALCFAQRGWRVTILERKQEIAEAGAGIQISPNAVRVFRALGLDAQLAEIADAPPALEMRDGLSGREIFSLPLTPERLSNWGAPYFHIHRSDLINLLNARVTQTLPEALQLDVSVEKIQSAGHPQKGGSYQVICDQGQRLQADLVIAADGIRSSLRDAHFPAQHARYSGYMAWRMTLENQGDINIPAGACVWTGTNQHAVTYPLRGGRLINFVGIVKRRDENKAADRESWTRRGTRAEACADFGQWHETITALISKADTPYCWSLYHRPPLSHWFDDRVIFIGDACHPILPFLAQGAAMAIEDGYLLAAIADRADGPQQIGAEFQALRLPRLKKIQRATARNGRLFHLPHPFRYIAQKGLVMANQWAPEFLLWQQNPVYQYDPTQDQ